MIIIMEYEFVARVDSRGKVSIPKTIRELLEIDELKSPAIRIKVCLASENFE
jgi:bifunctional DNA-binding transcriptional regulator/antitoxin component of YhaV-PrlF toxin-antitoxin module